MDHQTLSKPASDYRETIDWLFDLQFVGIKMGLENIRSLAAFWEHPQRRYPVVHIAGTNGKGSTASFIAAGLQAAGYRTGLYTSPHLVDFSERIRVDGVPITEQRVVEYTRALRAEIERLRATFFEATTLMAFRHFADEATTLMAFRHFADEGVDVAVVETGLGGRLDATNVVDPLLTVITSISVEHTEFLGETLAEITAEKAGIIKPGAPCVAARQEQEALDVLRRCAAAAGTSLHETGGWKSDLRILSSGGMECLLPGFTHPVEVGLSGQHQVENAATAVTALRLLRERGFPRLNDESIAEGLRDVRRLGGLRGRLEVLQRKPLLAVDVGHNPDGIRAMLEAWSAAHDIGHTDLVFGVLKNKDLQGIFRILARHCPRSVTLVQAESHEARTLEEMLRLAAEAGIEAAGRDNITAAVREKLVTAGEGTVLLFGSHYVVGAFLREWESPGAREKKR